MTGHFNSDLRHVLGFAAQEARDLDARTIGSEHILLGLLCNARTDSAAILNTQGLTLSGARAALIAYRESVGPDTEPNDESSVDADREALKGIGIDLDAVREAVKEAFDRDITEGWGERRGRRGERRGDPRERHGDPRERHGGRGRGRRPGGEHVPGEHGPHEHGPHEHGAHGHGPEDHRHAPGEHGPHPHGEPIEDRDGRRGGPWERRDFRGFGPEFGERRGRRGPRGFARMTPGAKDLVTGIVGDARAAGERNIPDLAVLRALLDAADPAVVAMIESATTVDAVKEAAGATSA